jgi:hypothetical protein
MLRRSGTQQCEGILKTVVARLFACAVLAHPVHSMAQQAPAPKAAATPGAVVAEPKTDTQQPAPAAVEAATQPVTPPAAEPAAPAEDAAVPEAGEQPEAAASEAAPVEEPHDIGTSRLEANLRKAEAARESYSRFWPWFTLTSGALMTVGGAAAGAAHVFGCDDGCSTSAWVGIAVATGTFIATIGTIWVVNANADVRELDSQRYQLQQELERIRFSSKLPNRSDSQASAPVVSWRWTL